MAEKMWVIRGYDSDKETFKRTLPVGRLSEAEMITLLQRLASRHLEDDEVVTSSLRKNAAWYTSHLEVRSSDGALETIGSGHHYTAVVREVG
ncbi:MAG: hypothetical protein QOK29_112 [Rhodospirillaceae bacterium]|nr:hypothetical protein [Rhodospirillaceae bacterium]